MTTLADVPPGHVLVGGLLVPTGEMTPYQLYEISGLLADLKGHLDPGLIEQIHKATSLGHLDRPGAEQVIQLLREHAKAFQVGDYTRREHGRLERVHGYARTPAELTAATLVELVVALVANESLKHPMHVKTPQGAKWYHQPIGSLIYAKPHLGEIGEKERVLWVGGKAYSIPMEAEVYVPGFVNVTNSAQVAESDKWVALGPAGAEGAKVHQIMAKGGTQDMPWTVQAKAGLKENGWKPLPAYAFETPVYVNGKLAAWVPSTWKLYIHKLTPTSGQVYSRSPDGTWHIFGIAADPAQAGLDGHVQSGTALVLDKALHEGNLLPYKPPGQHPENVNPPVAKEEPAGPPQWQPLVDIPGVGIKMDAAAISSAIQILSNDKSTAVKQPLAKAGHLLADMDYHGIAKAHIKAHPELKVAPGTKTKHVGQVKVAVIHYLNEQLQKIQATQAQHEQAKQAAEKSEAQAEHTQKLADNVLTIGGVTVTIPQAQQAIQILEGNKSTAIKQPLKAKGNPLGGSDYWSTVNAYKQSHTVLPTDNAKHLWLLAVKEMVGKAKWGIPQAAPEKAAPSLDEQISEVAAQIVTEPNDTTLAHKLAYAIKEADTYSITEHYVYRPASVNLGDGVEKWVITKKFPKLGETVSGSLVYRVQPWSVDKPLPGAAVTELTPSESIDSEVAAGTKLLTKQEVLDLLGSAPPATTQDLLHKVMETDTAKLYQLIDSYEIPNPTDLGLMSQQGFIWSASAIALALALTHKFNEDRYIVKQGGKWHVIISPEPSASQLYYTVTPHNEVILHKGSDFNSEATKWATADVLSVAQGGFKSLESWTPDSQSVVETPEPAEKPWNEEPGWLDFAELVLHQKFPPLSQKPELKKDENVVVAWLIKRALAVGSIRWAVRQDDGSFKVTNTAPEMGTLGHAAKPFYKAYPGQLEYYDLYGQKVGYDFATVKEMVEKGFAAVAPEPEEAAPSPSEAEHEPPEGDLAQQVLSAAQDAADKGDASYDFSLKFKLGWAVTNVHSEKYDKLWVNGGDPEWYVGTTPNEGYLVKKALDQVPEVWSTNADGVEDTYVPQWSVLDILQDKVPGSPGSVAEPVNSVPVSIKGKVAWLAPPGSKVYWSTKHGDNPDEIGTRYVKQPDGEWKTVSTTGVEPYNEHYENPDDLVAQGILKEAPESASLGQKMETYAEAGTIPVLIKGVKVGEVPAGSVIYRHKDPGVETRWIELPDGKSWMLADSKGIKSYPEGLNPNVLVQNVNDGVLVIDHEQPGNKLKGAPAPSAPEPPPELTALDKAIADAKHGAIDPEQEDAGGLEVKLAKAAVFAVKKHAYRYVAKDAAGQWGMKFYSPYGEVEYWKVGPDTYPADAPFEFVHHFADGHEEQGDPQMLADLMGKYVVPNATTLKGYGYGAKAKLYKYGFYYKPGSKQALEIKVGSGGSGISLLYHPANGGAPTPKKGTSAGKLLETMTEYHAQPKSPFQQAAKTGKASYATGYKPGQNYQVWEGANYSDPGQLVVQPDGSSIYTPPEGGVKVQESDFVTGLLHAGTLLDEYGSTVVKPGIQPPIYRLFNAKSYSREELEGLLQQIEQHGDVQSAKQWLGMDYGKQGWYAYQQFMQNKGHGTSAGYLDALKGLLRDMLEVPKSDPLEGVNIVFLKSTPDGLKSSLDVFEGNNLGYAKPFNGLFPENIYSLDVPSLNAKITAISDQFGGGKVVGTHLTKLTKADKQDWLHAWVSGDMKTVFALDAKGGKVSPVHPGAPKNIHTHSVAWAPWGAGEIPAGKPVEGDWTPLESGVTLPKAELDNYIIKAGLQHAEYLSLSERRAWVTNHRQGKQQQVDVGSKAATDRWLNHENLITEPPVWTDNIKPAKSYDVYLEEKAAADNWTMKALQDFINDHWDSDNLEEYDTEGHGQASILAGSYYVRPLVQRYLEHLAALEQAEKLKPRYHSVDLAGGTQPTDGGYQGVADQFGWKGWWKEGTPGQRAQDVAVATLSRLWGFRHPETRIASLGEDENAVEGVAHQVPDAAGWMSDLSADSLHELDQRAISDIAREHIFNWATDNATAHPGTLARLADGTVVATDHSGAFADFGHWQGLDLKEMDHYAYQAANQLYQAIKGHKLTKAVADQAYIDAIRAARRMSQLSDERYKEILEPAFALRDKAPDLDAVTARKNSLEADFQHLWESVYKQAHWKLPEVPKEALRGGLHSGFSEPSFFDHVMAAKSFGAPAFFGGPDAEGGHFLVWTELAGDGPTAPRLIRGESSAVGDALEKMTTWAKANQTGVVSNSGDGTLVSSEKTAAWVNGASDWYQGIISGAKAVSRHYQDQVWTGSYTAKQLSFFTNAKDAMEGRLKTADAAIAAGDSSKKYADFEAKFGSPEANHDAVIYYQGLAAKVDEHKEKSIGPFQQGDLPDWKPDKTKYEKKPKAEPKAAKPKLKVEKKQVVRQLGIPENEVTSSTHLLGQDDGELHVHDKVFNYPGTAWHVTLPTGEVIEFNDSDVTNTSKGQIGRIRFKADASKGSASLENIRAALQEMGMDLPEANEQDMELLYWRQLAYILANRQDHSAGPHAEVWKTLKDYFNTHKLEWSSGGVNGSAMAKNVTQLIHAKLPPVEEAELWHTAWAKVVGDQPLQDWVDKGKYLPHLKHWDVQNPEVPGGKPVWYKPTVEPGWLAGQEYLTHSFGNAGRDAVLVSRTGGAYSTEARLRALGTSITGMSSSTDMSSYGSAGVFYTRANKSHNAGSIKISPRVFAELPTYGFNRDAYGDIAARGSESWFDVPRITEHGKDGGQNEVLIRDGVSLLDDIEQMETSSDAQREQIIKELKANGVTQIRGLPVEERIVNSLGTHYTTLRTATKAESSKWFDHDEMPWQAPPSQVVTAAQSQIETATEEAGPQSFSDAEFHAGADSPETVPLKDMNQLFYGQDTHPGQAATWGEAAAPVKYASAARVAAAMDSSDVEMAELYSAGGLHVPDSYGATARDRVAAGLIQTWAQGNSSPIALAIQDEASQLFDIPKSALPPLGFASEANIAAAKELEDKFGDVIQDFVKAMWEGTQEDLAKLPGDAVELHRVFYFSSDPDWVKDKAVGNVIDAPPQRPLSSWALTASGATSAGTFTMSGHQVVVKTIVPKAMIVAYPKSGLGAWKEEEMIVRDAPGKWEIEKI